MGIKPKGLIHFNCIAFGRKKYKIIGARINQQQSTSFYVRSNDVEKKPIQFENVKLNRKLTNRVRSHMNGYVDFDHFMP